MASRSIFAQALFVAVAAVGCTQAPPSTGAPGTSVALNPPATSPTARPGAPAPDSRTPQPASDTAAPSPSTTPPAHPVATPAPSSERSADSARIADLEHAAVSLAKTTGCSSDEQCRNAPVGVKGCGGPRYYLKYCAASTDSVALFRALARLDSAERVYNSKYHIVSTCQMILPTRPHLVGGACH